MPGPASCVQDPFQMGVYLCLCGSFMSTERSRRTLISPKVSTSSEAYFSNEMCVFAPRPGSSTLCEEFTLNGLCLVTPLRCFCFHSATLRSVFLFHSFCQAFFTVPLCTGVERFLSFRQCLSLKACSRLSSPREPVQQGQISSLHIFCYFYSR